LTIAHYISPKIIGYYQHYKFVVMTLSAYVSYGASDMSTIRANATQHTQHANMAVIYLSTVVMSRCQTWACPVGKRWLFSLDVFPQTLPLWQLSLRYCSLITLVVVLLLSYGAPQARGISVW